jgi:hypothetical protein
MVAPATINMRRYFGIGRAPPTENASMNSSRMIVSLASVLAVAVAVMAAGCTNSDAYTRKAAPVKAGATQNQRQEKPVKMRYYGGPKSPMYPG